jgi:hypothetical protein
MGIDCCPLLANEMKLAEAEALTLALVRFSEAEGWSDHKVGGGGRLRKNQLIEFLRLMTDDEEDDSNEVQAFIM